MIQFWSLIIYAKFVNWNSYLEHVWNFGQYLYWKVPTFSFGQIYFIADLQLLYSELYFLILSGDRGNFCFLSKIFSKSFWTIAYSIIWVHCLLLTLLSTPCIKALYFYSIFLRNKKTGASLQLYHIAGFIILPLCIF